MTEGKSRIGRPPTCTCGECKKCKWAAYMRRWYERKTLEERRQYIARRNRERLIANDRARYDRDTEKRKEVAARWKKRNPALARAVNRRWDDRNPEKKAAHIAVHNAIRDGRLVRQPCEVCETVTVHAHHDDYSKPLDVRWLCVKHHGVHHRKPG